MKNFTYIALLVAAGLLLCGCESRDAREVRYYQHINVITTPDTDKTSVSAPEECEPDNARVETIQETEIEEELVQESVPEQTSVSTEISEKAPPEVTAETACAEEETFEEETNEEDAQLDYYYSGEYAAYDLTPKERAFTRESIFVGDSICRGFSEYKIVRSGNVFARGSVAARNFFDFTQFYGEEEVDFLTVLERKQPKYVFFSMGMNDINLSEEEDYCENYRKLIDLTLANSDAEIFVAAITPINSSFSSNYRIDCFNLRMEKYISENFSERVHYFDFAKHLKDADGNLKDCFNGGDGIHLAPYAYYVALWEMNRAIKADVIG